jgi:hypothetical protein
MRVTMTSSATLAPSIVTCPPPGDLPFRAYHTPRAEASSMNAG